MMIKERKERTGSGTRAGKLEEKDNGRKRVNMLLKNILIF